MGRSNTDGPLNGLSVTNGYDNFLRRTNLTALAGKSPLIQRNSLAPSFTLPGFRVFPRGQLHAAPSGPKPVTVLGKFTLEDGFQHVPDRPLHDPIADRRNTQRPLFLAAQFVNPAASHRSGNIAVRQQLLLPRL